MNFEVVSMIFVAGVLEIGYMDKGVGGIGVKECLCMNPFRRLRRRSSKMGDRQVGIWL